MSFELTDEQKAIVNTIYDDNKVIKINAFAGSGKTSSLVEIVKEIRKNDKDSKILYLVFNKSMVDDSKRKFDSLDLNVECYTTHSFALRRFSALRNGDVEVMPNLDYADYMKIKMTNTSYKYAKYKNVLDMLNAYCLTFDDLDTFCENLINKNSKPYNLEGNGIKSFEVKFFRDLYEYFVNHGKFTHNMYLKEYSVNGKDAVRGYKYVFLDEAQDLNPFMLNIINRIKRDKIWIVGDKYQQIYQWNHAINSMERYKGLTLPLTTSFRFNDDVCAIANKLLSLRYDDFDEGSIKNFHNNIEVADPHKKTILFRKNATMFEYAVNLIKNNDNCKVHFMDVVNGNNADCFEETFAEMLYFYDQLLEAKDSNSDMLAIYRDSFKIKRSKTIDNYINIAKKEGSDLYRYLCRNKNILSLDLIKFFNFFLMNEFDLIDVLERLRGSEDNDNPEKEYYLVTAHRSKGLEWSWVKIAQDDWKLSTDDEVNLLYVACTRAKNKLEHSVVDDLIEVTYGV